MENNEQVLTPTVIIENSIKQYNLTEAKIAEIAQQCAALQIQGVEDTAGYKAVKDAKNKVVKIRTGLDSKRKELGADYKKVVDAINGEAKRLTALVEPIEEAMVAKLQAIDDEVALMKSRDKEAKEKILKDAGFMFDGSNFFCVDVIVSPSNIEQWPLNFVQDAANKGAEALRKQRETKELEERMTGRVNKLLALGFTEVAKHDYYWIDENASNPEGGNGIGMLISPDVSDDTFDSLYEAAVKDIADRKAAAKKKADEEAAELEELRQFKLKKEKEEKEAKDATYEVRKQALIELGYEYEEDKEYCFSLDGKLYSDYRTKEDVYNATDIDFKQHIEDVKQGIETNKNEERAIALQTRTAYREVQLTELGFEPVVDGWERNACHVPTSLIETLEDDKWDTFYESLKDSIQGEGKTDPMDELQNVEFEPVPEIPIAVPFNGVTDEQTSMFSEPNGRRIPQGEGEHVEGLRGVMGNEPYWEKKGEVKEHIGKGEDIKEFHQTEKQQWIQEGFTNCQKQVMNAMYGNGCTAGDVECMEYIPDFVREN